MPKILTTSLAEIKSFNPCPSGWKIILAARRGTPMEEEFPLIDCVTSNDVYDVCWLLGKRKVEIDICIKFARMCADSVAHLNNYCSRLATDYADYANANAANDAANAADCAAANATNAANAAAGYATTDTTQREKNRQFLIQEIIDYQNNPLTD